MPDTYYALGKIQSRLRDDGTTAQFTLDLVRSTPARFFVSPEGLGRLLKSQGHRFADGSAAEGQRQGCCISSRGF
jgi:hypothetical protein